MENIKGKKILLIAPKFFNYEIEIKNKLTELGAEVDYYDERMNPTNLEKIIIRLNKKIIHRKIKKYYNQIIKKILEEKYHYIFIINLETIDLEIIQKMKEASKNSKIVLYMWDSIKNKKNVLEIIEECDSAFSFDSDDCKKYSKFKFKPLFYIDEYSNLSTKKIECKYDLSFIGTVHSDRYKILMDIKSQVEKKGLKIFLYMYFPSKILFYYNKIFNKSFKNVNINEFEFVSLNHKDLLKIILNSKVVIDMQHPNQNGLTMRTLEMLGMKKKLITTNEKIKEYDFYCNENISIIERESPKINIKFIKTPYKDIDKEIYKKYSLEMWLQTIFGESGEKNDIYYYTNV